LSQEIDRKLREKIQSMLDSHKEFKGYGLEVDVHRGKVQLSGIVDTQADGNRAVAAISNIDGVKEVENGTTISTDGAINDSEVAMEVAEELEADPRVNTGHVGAESVKGRVYLQGNVDSPEEEQAAINAASKARGVKEVISEVNVRPGGFDTDDPGTIFHHQVNNDREDEGETNLF